MASRTAGLCFRIHNAHWLDDTFSISVIIGSHWDNRQRQFIQRSSGAIPAVSQDAPSFNLVHHDIDGQTIHNIGWLCDISHHITEHSLEHLIREFYVSEIFIGIK